MPLLFESVLKNADPSLIFTTRKIYGDIQKNFSGEKCLEGLDYFIFEDIDMASGEWTAPGLSADDIAYIQYK